MHMIAFVVVSLFQRAHAAELLAEVRNIPSTCDVGSTLQFLSNKRGTGTSIQVVGTSFKLPNIETINITDSEATLNRATVGSIELVGGVLTQTKLSDHTQATFTKQVSFNSSVTIKCSANNCIFDGPVHFTENVDFGGDNGNYTELLNRIQALERLYNTSVRETL